VRKDGFTMRNGLRRLAVAGFVLALMLAAGLSAAQNVTTNVRINFSPLVENVKGGQIDWGKEMMYASGEGAMPSTAEEPNRARAKLKAKEYAKMAATANLLMLIEGTSISYNATGKNFMADDITLKQTIEGYVKNVNIVRTITRTEEGDTIVKVTVGTPMYGSDTPGSALLRKLSENELAETEPAPVKVEVPKEQPKKPEAKPETKPIVAKVEDDKAAKSEPEKESPPKEEAPAPEAVAKTDEPKAVAPKTPEPAVAVLSASVPAHTSVIIDTLGLNVMRAMSPKIRAKSGDEVWGTLKMNPDEIQDHGPVAYSRTLADATKCPRAGSNPLVLKAIGRAGGTRMCDVVLADDDVAKLKASDQVSKPPFLSAMKVILVVDPTKAFQL
jgi:hypothetical protein